MKDFRGTTASNTAQSHLRSQQEQKWQSIINKIQLFTGRYTGTGKKEPIKKKEKTLTQTPKTSYTQQDKRQGMGNLLALSRSCKALHIQEPWNWG